MKRNRIFGIVARISEYKNDAINLLKEIGYWKDH